MSLSTEVWRLAKSRPGWQEGTERTGQAVFNALHELEPEIADLVRGSSFDPFYDDEKLVEFWTWLSSWGSR